jgi:phage shock protein A
MVTGQENVVEPMKRWFVLVSLLLHGLITGCARDTDVRALQADTSALGRQTSERHQTVEVRLQRLSDSVTKFEQAQAETRRNVAQVAATLDELRVQLQRLQGDIQETQHQVQRGTVGGERISAMKLADFETRLRELEKQLGVSTP